MERTVDQWQPEVYKPDILSGAVIPAGVAGTIGFLVGGPVGAAVGAGGEFLAGLLSEKYFGPTAAKRVYELTQNRKLAEWAGDIAAILGGIAGGSLLTKGASKVLPKILTAETLARAARPIVKEETAALRASMFRYEQPKPPRVSVGAEMFIASPEALLTKTMGMYGEKIAALTQNYLARRSMRLGDLDRMVSTIKSEFAIRGLGPEDSQRIAELLWDIEKNPKLRSQLKDIAAGKKVVEGITADHAAIADKILELTDYVGQVLKKTGLPYRELYAIPHQYKLALFNPNLPIEPELEPLRQLTLNLIDNGIDKIPAVSIGRVLIGDLKPQTPAKLLFKEIANLKNPKKIIEYFSKPGELLQQMAKGELPNDVPFIKLLIWLAKSPTKLVEKLKNADWDSLVNLAQSIAVRTSTPIDVDTLALLIGAAGTDDLRVLANQISRALFARRGLSQYLKRRTFAIPRELRETDFSALLSDYSRTMADSLARAETFGNNYEKLYELYQMGRSVSKRWHGTTKPADEVFQRFYQELTKLYPGETESTITFIRDLQSLVGAIKLAFSWLPNLAQNIITATEFGYKNFVKALSKLGTEEARQFARRLGLNTLDIIREFYELAGIKGGKVEQFFKKHPILHALSRGPFIASERFNNYMAALTAREWLIDVWKKYQGRWSELPYGITRKLQKAGLTVNQLASARTIEELDKEITTLFAHYGRRLTQFGASILDKPLAWNSPIAQILTQFKLFGFNMSKYLKQALQESIIALKAGDPTPMYRLLSLGAALPITGTAIREFFRWVYNSDKPLPENKLARLLEYTAYAGGLGIIGDIMLGFAYNPNNPADIARRLATPVALSTIAEIVGQPIHAAKKAIEEGPQPKHVALALSASPIFKALWRHLNES